MSSDPIIVRVEHNARAWQVTHLGHFHCHA
jgi:hypothetical protein